MFELGSSPCFGFLFVWANHPVADEGGGDCHSQRTPEGIFVRSYKRECHYGSYNQNDQVHRIAAQLDSQAKRNKHSGRYPNPRKDRMGPSICGQADQGVPLPAPREQVECHVDGEADGDSHSASALNWVVAKGKCKRQQRQERAVGDDGAVGQKPNALVNVGELQSDVYRHSKHYDAERLPY